MKESKLMATPKRSRELIDSRLISQLLWGISLTSAYLRSTDLSVVAYELVLTYQKSLELLEPRPKASQAELDQMADALNTYSLPERPQGELAAKKELESVLKEVNASLSSKIRRRMDRGRRDYQRLR